MLSPKKIVQMAKNGQKLAASRRSKTMYFKPDNETSSTVSTSSVAEKGHFVVYTTDGARFVIPLTYLKNSVFNELLKMSEDEFGLPGDGPITFPCQAAFVEYILSLVQRSPSKDVEKALLLSLINCHNSSFSLGPQCQMRQKSQCVC